jgi:hypothetical protein
MEDTMTDISMNTIRAVEAGNAPVMTETRLRELLEQLEESVSAVECAEWGASTEIANRARKDVQTAREAIVAEVMAALRLAR